VNAWARLSSPKFSSKARLTSEQTVIASGLQAVAAEKNVPM
jgi:hypothetical protein